MKEFNFQNRGQSLIGIIIILVVVGLIGGGLYYYLSKQITEVSEIAEKPVEEEVTPLPEEEIVPEEITPEEKVEEKPTEEVEPEITCQDECSQTGLKRCSDNSYQICGNYDADTCLEWSLVISCPANTICQNGNCIQQRCADGTPYGQCSTNTPKYCKNGNLINKCSTCGCPSNQACQTDGSCKTVVAQTLLLLVEDNLYKGLTQELNTYSNNIKGEFGFQTILKTFPSSASVFEIKSYIKQIYNNYKLNGVLLIGNLPTGKLYSPEIAPGSIWYSEGLPLHDYIYQDIYDVCKYSKEREAFDYTSPGCEQNRIQPFWVSRLTPNSSLKDTLYLLKDYFKRNHEYRTGQYSYNQQILLYEPILLDYPDQQQRKDVILSIKKFLEFFNMYTENSYNFIDVEKENSDQLYLNEIQKTHKYENLFFNGHGSPTWHQKNFSSSDILNTSFFFGDFRSCSVGRFTTKDYIVGKYLFEGRGLAAIAASVPIFGSDHPNKELYYLLSIGEPLYEAIKISGLGATNALGDLTLRMRYDEKPSTHQFDDPIINLSHSHLYFTNTQPKINLKVKNLGKSTLKFMIYTNRYYKFKEEWQESFSYGYTGVEEEIYFSHIYSYLVNPNSEAVFTMEFPFEFNKPPAGTYKGEIFILSNDPVNPYISIPFEAIVK